jgi:hypothetical protein
MLIIYNEDYTKIEDTLTEFNSIHPNIQYTIEKQINNKLNYLDTSTENTQHIHLQHIQKTNQHRLNHT